ncbi:MAG: c-type cytochrome domain-containing protein [Rubripirellula sp.]
MNRHSFLCNTALILASVLTCNVQAEEADVASKVSFSEQVAPILLKRCVSCHGSKLAESGYRLDSYRSLLSEMVSGQQAVVSGVIAESELFQRLIHEDADLRMPAEANSLPDAEIELIKNWIEQGAVYDGVSPDQILSSLLPSRRHPSAPESYPASLPVSAIAIDLETKEILTGGYHELIIWNRSGQLLRRIGDQGQRTYSIDLHPTNRNILTSSGTPGLLGEVRIFDRQTGQLIGNLIQSDEVILDAEYSPDGMRVAVAKPDGSIDLYDANTNERILTLLGHSDQVTSVTWHSDGKRLGTTSRDKAAKIYDVDSGRSLATFSGHTDCVNALVFLDGDEVITVSDDGKAMVWSAQNGRKKRDALSGQTPLLVVSRTEKHYRIGGTNRLLTYELATHQKVAELPTDGDWVTSVPEKEDSGMLVFGLHSGEVRVGGGEKGIDQFSAQP